jgi:hypothetical protein
MTLAEVYRKTGERLCGIEQYDTIVRSPYWRTKEDHAQALEDIRLCAAAPDMLAALEAALELGAYRGDYMPLKAVKPTFDLMKAAINKAKGIK